MIKPINIDKNKFNNTMPYKEDIIPFEDYTAKKIFYQERDLLLYDLAQYIDMSSVGINENEKYLVTAILEDLCIDIESRIIIDITTTPIELGYLVLKIIRSVPLYKLK